jgi:hypothetical protein
MKAILPASLAVVGLLSGCASGLPGVRPLTFVSPGETHVFATGEKCPHEPANEEFGGLVAATLAGAASQLLKNFGTALSEGAKGGALTSSTSTLNLELDQGRIPKCVVIVRGAYQPTGSSTRFIDLASHIGLATDAADQRNRLTSLQIPALFRIDHYIEMRITGSANFKALTFAPLYLKLDQSIDGGRKGERDLSVALKFSRVGSDTLAGSAIVIADRRIGTASSWTRLLNGRYDIEAPWFGTFHAAPNPAGSGAPAGVTSSDQPSTPIAGPVGNGGAGTGSVAIGPPPPGGPGSTIPSMQSTGPNSVPVTLTATVVETRPTNEGLAFVASVFGGIQPKIETRLNQIIDSDARQTAENAETTSDLNAQAELATAEGAAKAAVIGYCSASSVDPEAAGKRDRVSNSQVARAAQLKANVAAIKAGKDLLYTNLVVVSAGLPNLVNSAPCNGV